MSLKTIEKLLAVEHENIAFKLGFVNTPPKMIDESLLYEAVGLIDTLSRKPDEASKNTAVCLIAVLLEYRRPEWQGLKDAFILFLSRMGFAPTATMTDEDYDREAMMHSSLQSYITELMIAIHQAKYEIAVKDKRFLLTEFQKEIWDKIDKYSVMGISAPNSAGKTFIILLKIIDLLLQKDGTIVYIVPNLSLISQISIDMRKLLKQFGFEEYEILTSYYESYGDKKKVFVLTQERAIAAFTRTENPFPDLRVFVVDEIQNIERVGNEDDQRAKILFDTIFEFKQRTKPDKIIVSGPRINNIKGLSDEMFQLKDSTDCSETLTSPVVNFTYSFTGTPKRMKFRQYSSITRIYREIAIDNTEIIAGIGQSLYTTDFYDFLNSVIFSLGDMLNIIFSPTAQQARKTALKIRPRNSQSKPEERLSSLIKYAAKTVHPDYDLCHTLKNRVAYHHGQLPSHMRRVIERALSDKIIKDIVCTTTLMQGVNLPVQNMIVRNPNLFTRRQKGHESAKLSRYEFANLRGRAGRLLKDFIGRAFVLDEKSFGQNDETEEKIQLSEEAKELKPQTVYSDTFNKYSEEILKDLKDDSPPKLPSDQPYHYLLPYIRQTIYKYGEKAKSRLNALGIELDESIFSETKTKLNNLAIPVDICYQNRYWDPLDLDLLFRSYNAGKIEELPRHRGNEIASRLKQLLLYLHKDFTYYCRRYNFEENDFALNQSGVHGNLWRICINAEKWQNEITLAQIFKDKYFADDDISEKIDTSLSVLNKKVCYGLPMLLKPLADFSESDNPILTYIEMGAYHPVTRKLIELGVPRETAICLKNEHFPRYTIETEDDLRRMIEFIKQIAPSLDYWIQVQLESII